LLDIRSVSTQIDTLTFREAGVAGSLVYEQKTVRLVDVHELARKIHPDWYAPQATLQTPEGSAPRILVAEDSDFFRKQLTAFFESDGYDILACEDGAVAWNALQEPGAHFDLVVTDIEMPNLDGLGLVRKIRKDSRLASMPVIAVTSLAGEDDVRRGQEVGVDEYHVKLDREVLMAAVGRMIKASLKTPARSLT
ncbi:MAG: response regulator, partial [Patescibacteria group bacterium]|nr:response regulator [Patescibacteria group bacterium]